MKAIVILVLVVVVVALVAIPAGTALQATFEQARANRIEEQARLEAARADAYAVRSQANQPMLLAITGLVLVAAVVGGVSAVVVASRPAPAPTMQSPPPPPQIVTIVLSQIPGESRLEYLRRIEAASQEYSFPLLLDAHQHVEVGRSLDRRA